MTSEDLKKILEQFAICVIHASRADMSVDYQYEIISGGIDTIVDTVMFCTDKNRAISPSIN